MSCMEVLVMGLLNHTLQNYIVFCLIANYISPLKSTVWFQMGTMSCTLANEKLVVHWQIQCLYIIITLDGLLNTLIFSNRITDCISSKKICLWVCKK